MSGYQLEMYTITCHVGIVQIRYLLYIILLWLAPAVHVLCYLFQYFVRGVLSVIGIRPCVN